MAHRTHLGSRPAKPSVFQNLASLGLASLLLLAAGTFLALGPLRGWLQPPPVEGLTARLSTDGRLLGHFPYPEAKESELVAVAPGMKLREEAAQSFLAMQKEAASEGISLTLLSAFRSVDEQKHLFFAVKAQRNQTAQDRAKVSAPPGFSEHSTGFAIDVGDLSQPHTNLSASFTQTRAYQWLKQNAARHQFALSFPLGNPQGVSFEPWHWRYEGSVHALRLFEPAQRLRRQPLP